MAAECKEQIIGMDWDLVLSQCFLSQQEKKWMTADLKIPSAIKKCIILSRMELQRSTPEF